MVGMLIFGPRLLELLGGRGNVLAQAIAYTQVFFGGAVLPWLLNTMAGVLRGTGNMKLPSLLMLNSAVWQIMLGGTLGLGLGPVPQFGMRGVAAGALIAYTDQYRRDELVPVLRPRPRRAKAARPAHPMGDVLRHPQGRRHRLLLAAAIGADDLDLHPYAGAGTAPRSSPATASARGSNSC